MWIGHAFGAIITIAVLSFGERAFWALARLAQLCISRILDSVFPVETPIAAQSRRAHRDVVATPRSLVFSIHRHRGPPALPIAH
jgi:hypothetical protein